MSLKLLWCMCLWSCLFVKTGLYPQNLCAQDQAQSHPHLYFDQDDVIRARERMNDPNQADFVRMGQAIMNSANNLIAREIPIYERQGAWTHFYICDGVGDGNDDPDDGCGGSLLYDEFSPNEHLCPRCGTVYTGDPYDQAWISYYNNTVARHIVTLGLAYQLTEDERFAIRVRSLVMKYAEMYPDFPAVDKYGGRDIGRARLFSQTLDEAVWMLDVLMGLDGVWESDAFSTEDQAYIEERLLRRLYRTIDLGDWGRGNFQAWITSAIGAIGFFLDDTNLINLALTGNRGFEYLIENAFLEDGFTFEGSVGYHYYSALPLLRLVRIAETNGVPLWSERFHQILTTPLYLVQPNGDFPRYNNSGRTQLRHQTFLYEMANGLSDDLIYDEVLSDLYVKQMIPRREFLPLFMGNDYERVPVDGYQDQVSESIGIETFRGDSNNPVMVFIDRGPHGGYHGHDDKLNLVLYGQSRELMSDLGSASLAEGLLESWLKRTVAHNTISVGELGQNPGPEILSPLMAKYDDFAGMQVIAIQAVDGIYPVGTNVERTLIKVADDYCLVLDDVTNAPAPIDILWHSLGLFDLPRDLDSSGYEPSDLQEQWQVSNVGYQHFQPPRLLNAPNAQSILSQTVNAGVHSTQWHLPLGFSDTMDDIAIWYGTGTLSEHKTEGNYSQRFLALPNRTTAIGKDLTHPDFQWDHLTHLTFDYFVEDDKTRVAFVSVQDPERRERYVYEFLVGEPNLWHTAEIDLNLPTRIEGVSDDRFRFEIGFYTVGEKRDSFWVYIDDIQATMGDVAEAPLLTGLSTQVVTDQPAELILADGPTLRPGELHGTQIIRVPESDAQVTTLLEAYGTTPQWQLSKIADHHYRITSDARQDELYFDPDRQAYHLYREEDRFPKKLVLYHSSEYQNGLFELTTSAPINLEVVFYLTDTGVAFEYQSSDVNQEITFSSEWLAFAEVFVDDESIQMSQGSITLPGGTHLVRFIQEATTVDDWRVHGEN